MNYVLGHTDKLQPKGTRGGPENHKRPVGFEGGAVR